MQTSAVTNPNSQPKADEIRRCYGRVVLLRTSLIGTVVVGPLVSVLDTPPRKMPTIDLHYIGAAVDGDLIGEGWVCMRGRSTVFVAAEVQTASGQLVAHGEMSPGDPMRATPPTYNACERDSNAPTSSTPPAKAAQAIVPPLCRLAIRNETCPRSKYRLAARA